MVHIKQSMPNMTGMTIDNGRLELLNVLGAGAYGTVYRAVDTSTSEPKYFAVKCLHQPMPGSRQSEFQTREFALQAIVGEHPNVLSIHKVISEELYVFVILDFCSGGDLHGAISRSQIFHNNVELVRRSFIELIDAVHFCHERGVFHRDIKPENVLCSQNGTNILLADFGLATTTRVSREFGCGSLTYMSPECIGQKVNTVTGVYSTRHSDIWSLGVIFTNMVVGRNPWKQATTDDECFSAYLDNPDFLQTVLPISNGANAILKRMFALNPLSRISLPELRKEILDMDTFLMSEAELENASEFVKIAAATYARPPTPIPQILLTSAFFNDSESSIETYSVGASLPLDDEELYVFPIPGENSSIDIGLGGLQPDVPNSPHVVNIVKFAIGSLSSSASSADISDGPITPETYPTFPAIEIPDFAEGENLGENQKTPKTVDEAPKTQKKSFWNAFGRLKGLTINYQKNT